MKKMFTTLALMSVFAVPFLHGGPGKAFGQAVANADKTWLVSHILGSLGL